jgi:hypothetical protein
MSNLAASSPIREPATGANGTVTDAWACRDGELLKEYGSRRSPVYIAIMKN